MTARHGISAAGNWVIDRIKIIDCYPVEGNLANVLTIEPPANGGAPYNVLLDLAKLKAGIPLQGIGALGDDEDADFVIGDCKKHGIECSQLKRKTSLPTSFTDVMNVKSTGYRTFFHARGANASLDISDFDPAKITGRIMLLGYLLLLDRLDQEDSEYGTRAARLLAMLSASGIETAVDVVSENSDRFSKIVTPALPHTDYLIVNEIEAGKTAGRPIRDEAGKVQRAILEEAALALLEKGVRKRVIIHFPEASFAVKRDGAGIEKIYQPSLKLPQGHIKGATGAGDAFCAGCLYGIHEGWETPRMLQFGSAMAAACLNHPTSSQGIKTLPETLKLIELYGQN